MDVSILICTRNRSYAICDSLKSVSQAMENVPELKTELIIIDNNSTDDTSKVITKWMNENKNINTKLILEKKKGLSHARNCGIQNSTGNLVVFTDDDCRMDSHYLIDMINHNINDTSPVIRGGRVELGDPSDINITTKTSNEKERWSKEERSARIKTIRGSIFGCNMVIPREALNTVGLFDIKLGAGQKIAGSEDSDFFCRAYIKGFTIEYVPDMCVHHFHGRKHIQDAKNLMIGYNTGAGALYIKHIFNDFDLFRPFIWNVKNLRKEIKTGENLYIPEYGLTYKKVVADNIKGMLLYVLAILTSRD